MNTYVPEYMLSAFRDQGVDTSSLIYRVHADSANEYDNTDVYIAVSRDTMYILFGRE